MYIAKNFANIINVWWVVITMEFKVKKIEYINKTFRMRRDLVERLSTVAQNEGVSVNELVVQCVEFALDNMKHLES